MIVTLINIVNLDGKIYNNTQIQNIMKEDVLCLIIQVFCKL